jgi:hypothetical protein
MKAKLEARAKFLTASQDGIDLLRLIQMIIHTFEGRSNFVNEANKLTGQFYGMKQGKYETIIHYQARFESMVNAMEEVNPCVLQHVAEKNGRTLATATAADREEARQRVIANQFIRAANYRYDGYKHELENGVLNGRDEYPATLADAAKVMDHSRVEDAPGHVLGSDGVAFLQAGAETKGQSSQGQNTQEENQHAHIQCFNCGTVATNKSKYSNDDYLHANTARKTKF